MEALTLRELERVLLPLPAVEMPVLLKDSLPLSVVACSSVANCPYLIEASAPSLFLATTLHVN